MKRLNKFWSICLLPFLLTACSQKSVTVNQQLLAEKFAANTTVKKSTLSDGTIFLLENRFCERNDCLSFLKENGINAQLVSKEDIFMRGIYSLSIEDIHFEYENSFISFIGRSGKEVVSL